MADEKGIIYQGGHAHTVKNLWSFCYYYTIGQVAIIGEKGELVERDKVCQLPGIYYIHYDASGYPPPMWTLAISLWYLLILFAILPALWIYRYERLRCFKKKV